MGQTIVEYAHRKDLIAALRDLRKQGVKPEIINNGRTLRFDLPDDQVDEAADGQTATDAPQTVADSQGVPGVPANPAGAADGPSDAPETVADGQAGSTPTVEAEDEDLIGDVPTAEDADGAASTASDEEVVRFVNDGTVESVTEAVEMGLFTAEQAVKAEQAGRQRKGILALGTTEG